MGESLLMKNFDLESPGISIYLSNHQVGPSTLLAAGHDCVPVMFAVDGANRISQGVKLEETK